MSRMLVQLLLVGYFLAYIFESESVWVVLAVLAVMVVVSSWIALRTIKVHRRLLYSRALSSIMLGGGINLILITWGVLDLQPWYQANSCIPLAGMIFANAMNSVSLAADRLAAEIGRARSFQSPIPCLPSVLFPCPA
jgi:putative ABC transport system permease protein